MAWVTKDSTETYNQTPEPPREYTKDEKAANWWHYHWMAVVVAVLVVVFGVWIIKDTVFQTRPDVQVAYVGTSDLPTDTVTALQDALTPFCSDLNGDGKVVVQVDSYTVDFDAANENTDAYYQMAGVTRLSAELSSGGKTYIFLLEDPEGFEAQHRRTAISGRHGARRPRDHRRRLARDGLPLDRLPRADRAGSGQL